jgi:hypothetical protein
MMEGGRQYGDFLPATPIAPGVASCCPLAGSVAPQFGFASIPYRRSRWHYCQGNNLQLFGDSGVLFVPILAHPAAALGVKRRNQRKKKRESFARKLGFFFLFSFALGLQRNATFLSATAKASSSSTSNKK